MARRTLPFPLFAAVCALACGTGNTGGNDGRGHLPEQGAHQHRCYQLVVRGEPMVYNGDTLEVPVDSLMIQMDIIGELVNGTYDWLPQEKDAMTGSFTGTVEDGLVTALYAHQAEGMQGKMEVLFRLEAHGLRIGSGDMVEAEGASVFKDRSKATFGELVPEVPCP